MLQLKGALKRYGSLRVLDGLDIAFPERGVVALLGPSGGGKTTLLRIIAGLERLDAGELALPPGARISMVFQEDRLIPWLSAAENIMAVLPPGGESGQTAARILESCGLAGARHKLPGELSGGMQRRVAIGRALAFGGDILLLDEPFKGLDPATREDVIRILPARRDAGLTIMVTHNIEEARRCADTVLHFTGPPLAPLQAL